MRAHLREAPPALKTGNFAKARNADSYVAIENGMIEIEKALTSDKPDIAKVAATVNEVMRLYNEALAEIVKDARARQ